MVRQKHRLKVLIFYVLILLCNDFIGKVNKSLAYTPCGKYIVYPLGSFVVLKNIVTEKEAFFDGHTSEISCVSVSPDGSRLASGQINLMGVKVRICHYLLLLC